MTLKKRATKSIAIALIGVTVSAPIFNTVSAMERTELNAEVNYNTISDEQNINFEEIRALFDNIEGNTRSNIVEMEEEGYKVVIDKNTGDIEHIYYNNDGSIKEQYSTNFYKNIDRFEEQFNQTNEIDTRLSGPVIYKNKTSWSPDMLQLQVKQVKKNGKTMHQCDMWNSKNKYKQEFRTKYTSSASVMAFDRAINETSNKWNLLASFTGTAVAVALASFFGPAGSATIAAMKAALIKLGFPGLAVSVDAIVKRWNAYSNAVRNGDHKYNAA